MRVLLSLILLLYFSSVCIADIYNPKPCNDDFVLPMPEGASMIFCPVFIGEGDKPFALKEFKLGDRAGGGFKEYPTDAVIGGSFITKTNNGQLDWVYYIGKYEVTESQYYAIMQSGTKSDSQEPIKEISWFDVQDFINKYNLWLFANAKDKLPKNEEFVGFLRLPTEIEWEFAARGGSRVEATHFDKKHPYTDQLSKYEWFEGPKSSHGKVKKIGLLEPNDLKIHDMLGNVSEMTSSIYQIEYYQGRTGGFVTKGGCYLTSENQVRSSLREEVPYYKLIGGNIIPTKQKTLGFRLVISSSIYASRETSKNLASEWENYVKKDRKAPITTPNAMPSTTVNLTNVQLADALKSVDTLDVELNKIKSNFNTISNTVKKNPDAVEKTSNNINDISQTIWEQLGLLKASFANVQATVKKAESDSSFAWVKVASETAYLIYSREMKELPAKRKAFEMAKNLGKSGVMDGLAKQITDKEKNIEDGLESYGFAFIQLEKISADSIKEGFERYKQFLERRNASQEQIKITELVSKHYQEYFQNRRLDIDKWKVDFATF